MVCPLGLVHSNHPRFLLSHLFSVSCVTFFLGLFPCLAGAWLPIVHKNFGEVDFLRSSLWKNVFISSFHLIWYSKLKIIFPQNFEDIAPMVSNVKDTDFYPLYATCFLSSLEAFRIFSFPSEFWNHEMMCPGLFSSILVVPVTTFQTRNVLSFNLGKIIFEVFH